MEVIGLGLGLVIVVLMGATLLALPHLLEGIVHAYVPHWMGRLPGISVGSRDLPAPLTVARPVADGYRGTKHVEAPGLRVRTWERALDDGTGELRIEVRNARTAIVTVPAKRRALVAHIRRANGTIRVRLLDVGDGRRLEARAVPACLALPLALPGYAVLMALMEGHGAASWIDAGLSTLLPTLVLFAVWVGVWWGFHTSRLHAAAELAMGELEAQLAVTLREQG